MKSLFVSSLLLLLSSCGNGSSGEDTFTFTGPITSIVNKWSSACFAETGRSYKLIINLNGNGVVEQLYKLYSEQVDCTGPFVYMKADESGVATFDFTHVSDLRPESVSDTPDDFYPVKVTDVNGTIEYVLMYAGVTNELHILPAITVMPGSAWSDWLAVPSIADFVAAPTSALDGVLHLIPAQDPECSILGNWSRCQVDGANSTRITLNVTNGNALSETIESYSNATCAGVSDGTFTLGGVLNLGALGASTFVAGATDIDIVPASGFDFGCGADITSYTVLKFIEGCSKILGSSTNPSCSPGSRASSLDSLAFVKPGF